ncbi:MAG: hypothetical protein FD176_3151 [Rhodospirillaceae bacterium]|nr:MAG: hypothetical protein FD176_3151 [Rhodospirillaceae bacterium]TNC93407.1 MAG: hypothetical protein FD119_4049 [Stygiobacter sp.]
MTLQSELTAAVAKVTADGALLHQIVHGPADGAVVTEGGTIKTVAAVLADIAAALDQEKAKAVAAADILYRMANGSATGADSLVETASGPVKTLQRAIADLEALYAAAPIGESLGQIQTALAEARTVLGQVQAEAAQISGTADQTTHAVGTTLAAQSACQQAAASAASAAQLAGDQAAQARSIMTTLSDLGLDGGDIAEIHALWEEATLLGLDLL